MPAPLARASGPGVFNGQVFPAFSGRMAAARRGNAGNPPGNSRPGHTRFPQGFR